MLHTIKRFAQPVVLPMVLPFSFGHFFRRQLTIGHARSLLMRALETREERFLDVAREEIYQQAASPYLNSSSCQPRRVHAAAIARRCAFRAAPLSLSRSFLTSATA
jgi:hypothetical protein